jgi:probable rRNA maturation factor
MSQERRRGAPSSARRRARSSLRVLIGDARGREVRTDGLARWLVHVAPPAARGIVSVAIVSDQCVRHLNRRYRGHDQATDVLSFQAEDYESSSSRSTFASAGSAVVPAPSASSQRFLGDIVIARGVARRQAKEAGHSEQVELRVLVLHGLLHLLGYDHERDRGQMRRLEQRLRRKGGLPESLIERHQPIRSSTGSRTPCRLQPDRENNMSGRISSLSRSLAPGPSIVDQRTHDTGRARLRRR